MFDLRAWFYERRGWLPHRRRRWAEVRKPGQVALRVWSGEHRLTVGEARWLAAELLLAARDARRAARKPEHSCLTHCIEIDHDAALAQARPFLESGASMNASGGPAPGGPPSGGE